jgi:uncharacterized membrane protein
VTNTKNSLFLPTIEPTTAFVFLGIVFGGLFVFLTPPFGVPDEKEHLYRAFQVSEGQLLAGKHEGKLGGFLPVSLQKCANLVPYLHDRKSKIKPEEIWKLFEVPLNSKDRGFLRFRYGRYSLVPYIPQSAGIGLGRLLALPPIALLYLGRMTNLVFWIVLVWSAIKITPIFKWVFLLLALTPMSIYMAASLSADCPTNALAFLATALFLNCAFREDNPIRRIDILVILLVTVCLSLSKVAYFPMTLMYLFIPAGRVGSTKKFLALFALLLFVNVAVAAAWNLSVTDLAALSSRPDDPARQIELIRSDLSAFLLVLLRTIRCFYYFLAKSFIGILGIHDQHLPQGHPELWGLLLLAVALIESKQNVSVGIKTKLISAFIILATVLVILTLTYIYWCPVGHNIVVGVQGRYFIPLGPLLLLLFYNNKLKLQDKSLPLFLVLCTIISLAVSLNTVINRFYW